MIVAWHTAEVRPVDVPLLVHDTVGVPVSSGGGRMVTAVAKAHCFLPAVYVNVAAALLAYGLFTEKPLTLPGGIEPIGVGEDFN